MATRRFSAIPVVKGALVDFLTGAAGGDLTVVYGIEADEQYDTLTVGHTFQAAGRTEQSWSLLGNSARKEEFSFDLTLKHLRFPRENETSDDVCRAAVEETFEMFASLEQALRQTPTLDPTLMSTENISIEKVELIQPTHAEISRSDGWEIQLYSGYSFACRI